jgi:SAM-dependent methyltransferase
MTAAIVMGVAGIVVLSTVMRPRRFGFALAAVVGAALLRDIASPGARDVLTERSFFGVYRVREIESRSLRQLIHGTTLHGAQSLDPSRRLEPLTYYHRAGPMGDLFGMSRAGSGLLRRVGVIGLGVGSLACHGRPGERWTFFEIDPLVLSIARDQDYFTFLRDCPPRTEVVIGDARLSLGNAALASFDVLVLDAFSSDAIPVHLLTREAFSLYHRVLAPNGLLAVHISNRYLDLEPVVAALIMDAGFVARMRADRVLSTTDDKLGYSGSVWILVARRVEHLGALATDARWIPPRRGRDIWTDDFSNVIRVLR